MDLWVKFPWTFDPWILWQHNLRSQRRNWRAPNQVYGLPLFGEGRRFSVRDGWKAGDIVDIPVNPTESGSNKVPVQFTTIAFRYAIPQVKLKIQEILLTNGYQVQKWKTGIISCRSTLESPGGVLFEIATDEPGSQLMRRRPIWGVVKITRLGWAK